MDVISRDILEWARDLAHIRDLVAGDSMDRGEPSRAPIMLKSGAGIVMPFRRPTQETVA